MRSSVTGLAAFLLAHLFVFASHSPAQTIIDVFGPPGSWQFGKEVKALPNGNFVVTNPLYDNGAIVDVGAVHLYNGATGALISTMTGARAGDQVGIGGIIVLSDGNFLIRSPLWDSSSFPNAGAITHCNGVTGCPATATTANSLTGTRTGDYDGSSVTILANGNFVIATPFWDSAPGADVGAVTWCNKATGGPKGAITFLNSLIGARPNDQVGEKVLALPTAF